MKIVKFILFIFFIFSHSTSAQDSLRKNMERHVLGMKHLNQAYEERISKFTLKSENACLYFEKLIQKRLKKVKAKSTLDFFKNSPNDFVKRIQGKSYSKIPYNALLDTAQVTLRYYKDNGFVQKHIDDAIQSQEALQGKLELLDEYRAWRQDRNLQIESLLSQYPKLGKYAIGLKKVAYYRNQQLSDIKETIQNKERIKNTLIKVLSKYPSFDKYFNKYKFFFNLGEDYNEKRSNDGLQSQHHANDMVGDKIGNAPNGSAVFQEKMSAGRDEFNKYKSRAQHLNNSGESPDFEIKDLKRKRLIKRFEPGYNIQFQRANFYFPSTANTAAQIGYKISKNCSAGIGFAYQLAMGQGWDKIKITHGGLGLRSFADYRIKGSFFLSGGFELLKNSTSIIASSTVRDWNGWKSSALLGLNKKTQIGPKWKMNTMVLLDFLANQQPKTDFIKVRMGYTL